VLSRPPPSASRIHTSEMSKDACMHAKVLSRPPVGAAPGPGLHSLCKGEAGAGHSWQQNNLRLVCLQENIPRANSLPPKSALRSLHALQGSQVQSVRLNSRNFRGKELPHVLAHRATAGAGILYYSSGGQCCMLPYS
jgi:hypothetical protein